MALGFLNLDEPTTCRLVCEAAVLVAHFVSLNFFKVLFNAVLCSKFKIVSFKKCLVWIYFFASSMV